MGQMVVIGFYENLIILNLKLLSLVEDQLVELYY